MKMNESTAFETAARVWLSVKRLEVKGNTYSESYARTVEKILLPRMQGMTLGEIDRHNVAEILGELAEIYSDSTLRKCQTVIDGIIAEANYSGAGLQPFKHIKIKSKVQKQIKRTYSGGEAVVLREFCQHHKWGLSIQLLLDLGLRCSEMLGLRWEDIDFDSKSIYIRRACVAVNHRPVVGMPKSRSSIRELPVPAALFDRLGSLYQGQSGYIINTGATLMTSANYTKNRYNRFFADLQIATSLYRLSPHELRHTCGTLLYNKTGDIHAVSKFLGHSTVSITSMYYVHSDVEILRERLGM